MGWPLIPYLEPCSSGPWGGRSVGCWLGPRGPLTGVRVDQEGACPPHHKKGEGPALLTTNPLAFLFPH